MSPYLLSYLGKVILQISFLLKVNNDDKDDDFGQDVYFNDNDFDNDSTSRDTPFISVHSLIIRVECQVFLNFP